MYISRVPLRGKVTLRLLKICVNIADMAEWSRAIYIIYCKGNSYGQVRSCIYIQRDVFDFLILGLRSLKEVS